MEKQLGKLSKVKFGLGGYQGVQFGLSVTIEGKGWGVGDFKGGWDCENIKHTEHTKWTEEDRAKTHDELIRYISKLLKDAKVDSVDKLEGIPVEATMDGNMLKEWRILTEVL